MPALADVVTSTDRVRRSVIVRAGPDTATPAIGRLSPGDIATLEDEVPGWYLVRLVDGTSGYVSKAWTRPDTRAPAPSSNAVGTGPYRVHVIDVGTRLSIFVGVLDSRSSTTVESRTILPTAPTIAFSPIFGWSGRTLRRSITSCSVMRTRMMSS